MNVPINPTLPENFDCTPNGARPPEHMAWWDRPFIQTFTCPRSADEDLRRQWVRAWPNGTRYDVRCLDGGAWDRPTCLGMFPSLEEAVACAEAHYRVETGAPGMGEFYEHFM